MPPQAPPPYSPRTGEVQPRRRTQAKTGSAKVVIGAVIFLLAIYVLCECLAMVAAFRVLRVALDRAQLASNQLRACIDLSVLWKEKHEKVAALSLIFLCWWGDFASFMAIPILGAPPAVLSTLRAGYRATRLLATIALEYHIFLEITDFIDFLVRFYTTLNLTMSAFVVVADSGQKFLSLASSVGGAFIAMLFCMVVLIPFL